MVFVIVEVLGDKSPDEKVIKDRIVNSKDSIYHEYDVVTKLINDKQLEAYIKDYMNPEKAETKY